MIFVGIVFFVAGCSKSSKPRQYRVNDITDSPGTNLGSIYDVNVTFDNQNGERVPWQSLRGKIRVMAMIFTHCPAACPVITQQIKAVESLIPPAAREQVGYTLISFDSKRDTAAQLKDYYAMQRLDSNWQLLHGAPYDIQTIAALLNVQYKEWPGGDFTHANVIFVIDPQGHIALREEGLNSKNPSIIAHAVARLSQSSS